MKSRKTVLGHWQCRSGNECAVTVSETSAEEVRLFFTWTQVPSADDREEWHFAIFNEAVSRFREYAFLNKACIQVLRDLEATGDFRRVGINDEGDWKFGTEAELN